VGEGVGHRIERSSSPERLLLPWLELISGELRRFGGRTLDLQIGRESIQ
jgi:hypothetical protein